MLGFLRTMANGLAKETEPFVPTAVPALNVWDDGDAYVVETELPGVKLDDVQVAIEGDGLIIRGQRKAETETKGDLLRRERLFEAFERALPLPGSIDAGKIQAALKNGVLTVTLPKAEAAKPRRIEIKVK